MQNAAPYSAATRVARAARRAQIAQKGVHRFRHTFCSHLAMGGAPARAIQELAGHKDLATTQRHVHLSPTALDSAIRLLDCAGMPGSCGDMLETQISESAISNT